MVGRIPIAPGLEALVDDEDYERVAAHTWLPQRAYRSDETLRSVYVYARINRRKVFLHRFIVGSIKSDVIDHIDGNGLDNRRQNLREASCRQNAANSRLKPGVSGFRGVRWEAAKARWRVELGAGQTRKHIGFFKDVTEAARAYDAAALETWGEFAALNFPADRPTAAVRRPHCQNVDRCASKGFSHCPSCHALSLSLVRDEAYSARQRRSGSFRYSKAS